MTVDAQQPRGSLIGHILKRIFLALFGYLVALVVGLVAIVVLYSILSYLPVSPDYFKLMSLAPIALLLVSPLWFFYFFIAIVATMVPAAVVMLAGEMLSLRKAWLNVLFGGAVALVGYTLLSTETYTVSAAQAPADFGVIFGAGLVGGFIYWLIAGRDAGFRRRPYPAILKAGGVERR
ncbi:MAG: hypothetical protein AB7I34_08110 [Rhizobiaceae bacterium]